MPEISFLDQVNALSDQTIQLCYHCHKCTAGCPVAGQMDFGPDRILRMVQLGEKDRLLRSEDIWVCVGCETCGARCPNEINAARVLGALRELAFVENAAIAEPSAVKFHRIFLGLVQRTGRMHEVSLLALHKLWTLNLFADLPAGARLFLMGKVPLMPSLIKGHAEINRIYAASAKPPAADPREKEEPHGD
jgi:heterodisulfide reductase subunit C2